MVAAIVGCAPLRTEVPRPPSYALANPEQTALGKSFSARIASHQGQSGFLLLDQGSEALSARSGLADTAQRTLDLQYFIVEDDRTTSALLNRIVAAAQRGVRVRILLDDLHSNNRKFALKAQSRHANIEVRMFNPFASGSTDAIARAGEFLADGDRLNRRMHNKVWIADNVAGVVGGRNLGDAYFEADLEASFSDLDLLAVGPVTQQLSRGFDTYWNSESAVPVTALYDASDSVLSGVSPPTTGELNENRGPDEGVTGKSIDELADHLRNGAIALIWAPAQAVLDSPMKATQQMAEADKPSPHLSVVLGTARSEVLVISPYFIPSEAGRRLLGEAGQRGVRVAVLTNSLASTDVPSVHAGYAPYRPDLLRQGVELYELKPRVQDPSAHRGHRWRRSASASLHAKLVVVDRQTVFIGSFNMDPRSRSHNTETWVSIQSEELASRFSEVFEEVTRPEHAYKVELANKGQSGNDLVWTESERGQEIRYALDPEVGPLTLLMQSILRLLIPEHML